MLKKISIGLAALGAAAAGTYALFIRPWQLHWGATKEEVHQPLPGDAWIPHPRMETTRAITIQARPAAVWSWLVQMGTGHAGWYSYAWLENLLPSSAVGAGITNAQQIIPAFQHLEVGDSIPLSPTTGLTVGAIDPPHVLALRVTMSFLTGMPLAPDEPKPDAFLDGSWVFVLEEIDEQTTRLIERVRADYQPHLWLAPLVYLLLEPAFFVMERKMLLGIKQRAEKERWSGTSPSAVPLRASPARTEYRTLSPIHVFTNARLSIRAAAKTVIFVLKLFPMLPSRPVNWVTKPPLIEKVRYPTHHGQVEGELYRPSAGGPHPGVVVCLGVVPFGVDHPQVPHLEEALARAGFAALIYWSPAMRDLRFDSEDIENIALVYQWLLEQPYVDPARSGLIGTCVGGSFALMAAASPLIRDRVAFVLAYAPYASMWSLVRDIVSATRSCGETRERWQVDQLTRKVFVRTLTSFLEPGEAERLRNAFTEQGGQLDSRDLSDDGLAVYPLLTALSVDEAETALHRLPPAIQQCLSDLSPMSYLKDLHAPLIVVLHDRGDQVIPVGESRSLCSALAGRTEVHFTEMLFQHLDPAKGRLPLFRLLGELGKFFFAMYLAIRQTVASERGHVRLTSPAEAGPLIAQTAGGRRE
jgi:hypothetical protein